MATNLVIPSLRGGLNDTEAQHSLADDQCTEAMNVEFYNATVAERRLGCEPYSIVGSGLDTEDAIVHLSVRFPTNDIIRPEYWAISATVGGAVKIARQYASLWNTVFVLDPPLTIAPDIYQIMSQSLDGKLFFAYHSATDRLHVWDGTTLRTVGLTGPLAPPTAVDEGVDTFITTRYYRFRYIVMSGSTILRRSEPSPDVTFVPSGTGKGARVTRSGLIGEGETHWELEASIDGSIFYRIQTLLIGQNYADDETDLATTAYSDLGPVSEPIGAYLTIPSVRFIAADADRLLLGGHWTDPQLQSRVMWTPVRADPGVGNDERIPLSTGGDNFVDLDNYEGGALTGISQMANGTWYAFKWSQIYKMARTGDLTHAYAPIAISKVRGALQGSIVSGIDEAGRPCLYFLDPAVGPCMLGSFGLREIEGLRNTWKRVSYDPYGIAARGVYYPDKQQIHWWVSVDNHDFPNMKIVVQVGELRASGSGNVTGGISLANGKITTAYCACIWPEISNGGGNTQVMTHRPFIGLPAPDFIQRTDVGDIDSDTGYHAVVTSRPFFLSGLLNQWGAMNSGLLATANALATIIVSCIRDFGLETNSRQLTLAPALAEPLVIKTLDDLVMSESKAIQFRIEDP